MTLIASSRFPGLWSIGTPGSLPLVLNPEARTERRSRNIVSGISAHVPASEMWMSPLRCASETSLGSCSKRRYSEKTDLPVWCSNDSASPSSPPALASSCVTSKTGSPRRVSLCLYSSRFCSTRSELTISLMRGAVRYWVWNL